MPEKDKKIFVTTERADLFWVCPKCGSHNPYRWEGETEIQIECLHCDIGNVNVLLPGQRICGACKGEGITLHAPCAGADVSESQTGPCSRCYGKGYV